MAHVGVVLSGCGVMDGSEIHEAVCTLIALSEAGATYRCMAPDAPQMHVMNHLEGKPADDESRNILVESARIARGEIDALGSVNVNDYDAFIFPGGFGAAKNLCTFAVDGADCSVNPDVALLVKEAHAAGKPLAFVCIAPVIGAKVLGSTGAKLTIGTDEGTAQAINTMGGSHVECPVKEAVIDVENKIISTPAYMTAQNVSEVFAGVTKTVGELLKMTG